jgi:hypothetical protein
MSRIEMIDIKAEFTLTQRFVRVIALCDRRKCLKSIMRSEEMWSFRRCLDGLDSSRTDSRLVRVERREKGEASVGDDAGQLRVYRITSAINSVAPCRCRCFLPTESSLSHNILSKRHCDARRMRPPPLFRRLPVLIDTRHHGRKQPRPRARRRTWLR